MATLALEHVSKIFRNGVRAVDDLSLAAADGELLVLVGPSGCGKTTTLRMVAGLETPSHGTIAIDARPAERLSPKDRDVAMVFQHGGLYPHLSVAGNLAFSLKLRHVARGEIERRVRAAAELLAIGELLNRRVGELSGGQRQRVALGRAIVRQPKLFLFDEPLSSLDTALRAEMRGEIRRLQSRLGTTTVYVTHDQTEAMTLGTRIAVLAGGRLQQVADPQTIYERPANRFVAALIGSPPMNFLEGRVERQGDDLKFEISDLRFEISDRPSIAIPIPPAWAKPLAIHGGTRFTVGIRPEHIAVATAADSDDAARLTAEVERVERLGPQCHVYLRAASQPLVACLPAAADDGIGHRIEVRFPSAAWHFFDVETGQALAADGVE